MSNLVLEMLALFIIVCYYILLNVMEEAILSYDLFLEHFRSLFFNGFWDFFSFFIHAKYFIIFLLCLPLFISFFYFFLFLFPRYSFSSYKNFFWSKELVVFWGFFYFFLFILVLEDFLFYTETYRIHFLFPFEEYNTGFINYKR